VLHDGCFGVEPSGSLARDQKQYGGTRSVADKQYGGTCSVADKLMAKKSIRLAVYQRRTSSVKRMPELENNLMNFMLPFSLANLAQDRKTRSRDEIRNKKCWEDGLQNWSESQFKKRLRVNRDTVHFILGEIEDLI